MQNMTKSEAATYDSEFARGQSDYRKDLVYRPGDSSWGYCDGWTAAAEDSSYWADRDAPAHEAP